MNDIKGKSAFTLTEISRICNVAAQTVDRWNRYHNLKTDDQGRVHRETFIWFLKYSGQTEVLKWI